MTRVDKMFKKSVAVVMATLVCSVSFFNISYALEYNDTGDSTVKEEVSFTKEEQAYIDNAKTLVAGVQTNRAAYSYVNSEGDRVGIDVDIINQISDISGLEFDIVPLDQGEKVMDALDSGRYDLVVGVERDNFANREGYATTDSYINADITIVGRKQGDVDVYDKITCAVLPQFQALQDEIKAAYPNFKLKFYDNNEECMEAVSKGEADLMMQNTYVIGQLIQKPKYENLEILPLQLSVEHDAIATKADNQLLDSILDKSVKGLEIHDVNNAIIRHTFANRYKYTLSDVLYKFKTEFIVTAILVMACIALLIRMYLMKNKNYKILEKKNKQLAVAIDMANSANASKSQFLAQMSHEIRTPMNAIIGLVTIAKNEIYNADKIKEYLTKIDGSSKLLLGIINDILDMSAIENNKLKIAYQEFDFKQLLSSVTSVFYQQCKQKNIAFELKMKGVTEEKLNGDSLRVNQIMMNLLSNAVKFTPSNGKINVEVIQAYKMKEKVYMRFIVSDSGCGMSEDLQKRLFNPFEQEDATTARKHGGSGLGLSITKNLIGLMGGSIQVESTKDVGTKFTVDIPFGMAEGWDIKDEVAMANLSDVRALVIDDDRDSCEYTGILLDRLGVKYQYVTSGEAALEEIGEAEDKGASYNLCIIDWQMPDMDGLEVTRQIRNIFGEETIVIIVSAYDLNEIESLGRKVGADYFVPKPLFQSTIFDAIMQVTNNRYNIENVEKQDTSEYRLEGHRVLIAEDVALNMEIAIKLLEMVGIKSECAEDGKQAVDMYEASEEFYYDAILLDINMPVMDGYEAARCIRASNREDSKGIPMYAMTANAFTEDVTASLDTGMNGHIAKPIELDILYKTLKNAFEEGDKR